MMSNMMSASDFHLENLEGSTPELYDSIQYGDRETHDYKGDYSRTKNVMQNGEYVRGVIEGERKRVTIAEAALSDSPLQCWDNSTRGLDSPNANGFCNLRCF